MIRYDGKEVSVDRLVEELIADEQDFQDFNLRFDPIKFIQKESPDITDSEFRQVIEKYYKWR
jgi:hypothetical protein